MTSLEGSPIPWNKKNTSITTPINTSIPYRVLLTIYFSILIKCKSGHGFEQDLRS
jgi:hypothetical protein